MSELKARRAYFSEDEYDKGAHKICAKVSDCGYDRRNDWWSYAFEDEVYLKSEADEVIAELKADYKEACGRLQTANLIKDEQLAATRHSKYKRCLAMARACTNGRDYSDSICFRRAIRFYARWEKRWLELAEKFKEAKNG